MRTLKIFVLLGSFICIGVAFASSDIDTYLELKRLSRSEYLYGDIESAKSRLIDYIDYVDAIDYELKRELHDKYISDVETDVFLARMRCLVVCLKVNDLDRARRVIADVIASGKYHIDGLDDYEKAIIQIERWFYLESSLAMPSWVNDGFKLHFLEWVRSYASE